MEQNTDVKVTDRDVTLLYSNMINLGGAWTSDIQSHSDEFYIRRTTTGDKVLLGDDKYLAVYGSTAKDATIMNPLVDDGGANLEFYRMCTFSLSAMLVGILRFLVEYGSKCAESSKVVPTLAKTTKKTGAKNKKTGTTESSPVLPEANPKDYNISEEHKLMAAKLLTGVATSFKSDTIKYFDRAIAHSEKHPIRNFISIRYDEGTRTSTMCCRALTEEYQSKYPGVTQTHWNIFNTLIRRVLDIEDGATISHTAAPMVSPKFESFAHVYLSIYERVMKYLPLINKTPDPHMFDVTKAYLPLISKLCAIARWATTSSSSAAVTTPGTNRAGGTALPVNEKTSFGQRLVPVGTVNDNTAPWDTGAGTNVFNAASTRTSIVSAPFNPFARGIPSTASVRPSVSAVLPASSLIPIGNSPICVSVAPLSLGGTTSEQFNADEVNSENPFARA